MRLDIWLTSILDEVKSIETVLGDEVKLDCDLAEEEGRTIRWDGWGKQRAGPLGQDQSQQLLFRGISLQDEGLYRCSSTDLNDTTSVLYGSFIHVHVQGNADISASKGSISR